MFVPKEAKIAGSIGGVVVNQSDFVKRIRRDRKKNSLDLFNIREIILIF